MPTIKDIAKASGVSHGTVSNVLNKKGNVSVEKIKLVEKVALELGYNINQKAKSLRQNTTQSIALILPTIERPEYADIYMYVKNYAESFDYTTYLFITNDIPAQEKDILKQVISLRIKGLLSVSCLDNAEKYYKQPGLLDAQLIFLERKKAEPFPFVAFDYYHVGSEIGAYLNQKNYENVALFTGDTTFSSQHDFLKGITSSIKDSIHITHVESHLNQLCQASFQLFSEQQQPDAIVLTSDYMVDVVLSAHRLGSFHKQPDMISLSTLRSYQNRTVENYQLNYKLLGQTSCEELMNRLENNKKTSDSIILNADGFKTSFSAPASKFAHKKLNVLFLDCPSTTALKKLTPYFTKKTGIEVIFHVYPLSEIYDVISNVGDSGVYDVIRMDMAWLPWFAEKTLLPLDQVNPKIDDLFSTYLPYLKEKYSEVQGVPYALPFDPSVQMMFYRKDLFEDEIYKRAYYEQTKKQLKVPETFEEYNQMIKFFTKKYNAESPTEYGATVALGYPSSIVSEFMPRLLCCEEIYDERGWINFTSSAAITALKNYMETTKCANLSESQWWKSVVNNFVKGNAATTIVYTNHAADLIHAEDSKVAGKIGYASVPGKKPLLGGGVIGISNQSKKVEEAYTFIDWACSESIATEITMLGGMSPRAKTYKNQEILTTYPWLQQLTDNIKIGERRRALSNSETTINQRRFENIFGIAIKNAIVGAYSPEEAMEYAAQSLLQCQL